MKIIRSAQGKGGQKEVPKGAGPGHGQSASGNHPGVPVGNPESLQAMLADIRVYRAGDMPLQSLVSELEYHLQALIMDDHHWQSTFFERWRELDRYQAWQLASGKTEIDDDASRRIDAEIEGLRQLITSVLAGAETR